MERERTIDDDNSDGGDDNDDGNDDEERNEDDGIPGTSNGERERRREFREDRRRRCTTCGRRSNNCPPCIAVEGSPTTWLVPGVAGVQLPMQRRRRASPRVPGACVLAAALVCSAFSPLAPPPPSAPPLPPAYLLPLFLHALPSSSLINGVAGGAATSRGYRGGRLAGWWIAGNPLRRRCGSRPSILYEFGARPTPVTAVGG